MPHCLNFNKCLSKRTPAKNLKQPPHSSMKRRVRTPPKRLVFVILLIQSVVIKRSQLTVAVTAQTGTAAMGTALVPGFICVLGTFLSLPTLKAVI